MKKIFLFLLAVLLLTTCEKEQATLIENDANAETVLGFRDDHTATIALVDNLIAQVNQMMADGRIENGPGKSILSKLKSIKAKLESGQTHVVLSKLAALMEHLEHLATEGLLDESEMEDLMAQIETINCATEPFDGDGDGYFCDVDCDDSNPVIHPGAEEICDNGVDDDCDGDVDEADSDCLMCSTDQLLPVAVSTSSGNYTLFVHPTNNSTGIQYGGYGVLIDARDWEDGAGNTQKIVDYLGDNGGVPYAAKVCADLAANGCEDWYLPAKKELNAMFTQLGPGGSGDISGLALWSSTEITGTAAWTQNFNNGQENAHPKDYTGDGCRCVRRGE